MDKLSLTSDDKLLKMIEKSAIVRENSDKILPIAKNERSKFSLKNFFSRDKIYSYFSLQIISKVIVGFCVLVIIFWIFDFAKDSNSFGKRMKKLEAYVPEENKRISNPMLQKEINMPELLYESESRNMFSLAQLKTESLPSQAEDYSAMLKDFKLVGIMWSDSPQAMVENVKEAKTYLLSVNDNLGQFMVIRILKDKVFVGKDGAEWELR